MVASLSRTLFCWIRYCRWSRSQQKYSTLARRRIVCWASSSLSSMSCCRQCQIQMSSMILHRLRLSALKATTLSLRLCGPYSPWSAVIRTFKRLSLLPLKLPSPIFLETLARFRATLITWAPPRTRTSHLTRSSSLISQYWTQLRVLRIIAVAKSWTTTSKICQSRLLSIKRCSETLSLVKICRQASNSCKAREPTYLSRMLLRMRTGVRLSD